MSCDLPSPDWRRFLTTRLPAALLAIALLCEAAAFALRSVTPYRHYLDYLAAAVETDPTHAPIAILGDSITKEPLKLYRIAPPEHVADLTTHGGAGLPSMYLLLERYFAAHPAPEHIVIAAGPDILWKPPEGKTAEIWLTSVFTRPHEQAWLARFYPALIRLRARPAAADIERRVLAPLTGLLAPRRKAIPVGSEGLEAAAAKIEAPLPLSREAERAARQRAEVALAMHPTSRASLQSICRLVRRHGAELHFIIAPIPEQVARRWDERAEFQALLAGLDGLLAHECGRWRRADVAAGTQVPNFDDFALHIAGRGWQSWYALQLKKYVAAIRTKKGGSP